MAFLWVIKINTLGFFDVTLYSLYEYVRISDVGLRSNQIYILTGLEY